MNQNRQPVQAPKGQEYGARKRSEEAQRAVPLPANPRPIVPLDAPSQRPEEPLTAGLPMGPGPGPEALGVGADDIETQLRALYQAFPDENIRLLIEMYHRGF